VSVAAVVAWGLWVAWAALCAAFLLSGLADDPARAILGVLATLALMTVGAVVASRRPRNPIGWMFCVAGLGFLAGGSSGVYATRALVVAPGSLPAGVAVAWLATWLQYPVVMLSVYLLLLFPTGALPSRRWRVVAWLHAVTMVTATLSEALRPGPLTAGPTAALLPVVNPLGIAAFADGFAVVGMIWPPAFLAALVVSAGALALRFRSARGGERQQMKWFVYAGVGSILAVLLSNLTAPVLPEALRGAFRTTTFVTAMAAFPISVGIALLRYRLYDIDVLIRRTLVYGALSATLVAAYAAAVVLLQAALRPLIGGSELAVAGSTLAVVALVQPLRRRIQDLVDRRFYRSRYDAARTLDTFTTRMRDQVDIDAVRGEVLDVVSTTLRPAHASVWLRGPHR